MRSLGLVPDRERSRSGSRRAFPVTRARRGSRDRRRVGFRQDRLDDGRDGLDPRPECRDRGPGAAARARSDATAPKRDAARPRRRDRDDLPGPDDGADAGVHRRLADRRAAARASSHDTEAGPGAGRRAARGSRHLESGAAARRLSAPVLGRDAAAGDDRDGALVQSVDPDRRRADDRARRHDPGADPRADEAAPARPRLLDPPDHARHGGRLRSRRACCGDVRRQCGRGGVEGRRVPRPAAPLHVGASRLDSARRAPARPPARRDSGPAAVPDRPARGLPVCPALPAPVRPLLGPPRARTSRVGEPPRRVPSRSCDPPVSASQVGRVSETLLEARDLVKHFPVRRSKDMVHAVDGVSLEVHRGETLGIVGESGCGKSTLGRLLVRLHDPTSGTVRFRGDDITKLSRRELRPYRREMQMIFQDPYASLNPRKRVGQIVSDPFQIHRAGSREETRRRVQELLEVVGLSPHHVNRYPHEFSGGQRQRIGVARALALSPQLIVADEPVSALDVSIQAQVINLLDDLQDDFQLTYVFIAHDLGVVHHVSDRIAVMYLGVVVEIGPSDPLFLHPIHPYTEALLSAIPPIEADDEARRERIVLRGEVPSPIDPPSGCRFHPRCRYATEICSVEEPVLADHGGGRFAACHHPLDAKGA
ncbi:MAG: dipeptide ABC transporter ATP-binding protein [Actinobacteria bacterium]|nr:MAG: dipeptide ABC transporter ATP-binding protein [Actinomycetota bacterium]